LLPEQLSLIDPINSINVFRDPTGISRRGSSEVEEEATGSISKNETGADITVVDAQTLCKVVISVQVVYLLQ
jgi:hypothetical protein